MKNFLLGLCCIVLISSCGVGYRLKGSYPEPTATVETSLSFEDTWSRLIDYFAASGIPIATLDKSSGFIVSSQVSFVNNYTREKSDGSLVDPKAYVVIPTVRGGFGNILEPNAAITGNWVMSGTFNVRVRPTVDGKQSVTVNLLNLICTYSSGSFIGGTEKIPIKSTGQFEQGLCNYITGK